MGRGRRKSASLPKGQEAGSAELKVKDGVGAFGLPEAPVFFPTEEEFVNPLLYIAQIRAEAEAYGICRIVPPTSWNPPFGLDTVKFTFPTKLQAIHHLQERPAACDADTFKLEYSRFLRKTGETVERWPSLDGEELDLCKLFNAVKRHGGHEKVTLEDRWGEVVRMVTAGVSSGALSSSSTSSTLRQIYESHLSTFEVYQTKVAAGKRWRAKAKQESTEKLANKPGRAGRKRQSDGGVDLDSPLVSKKAESAENELFEVLRPASEVETRSQGKRSGRRRQSGVDVDHEASGESRKVDSGAHDLSEVLRSSGEVDSRLQPNPPAQRKRRKTGEKFTVPGEGLGRTDQICEQCNSGAHEQLMLLCDRCDRGWHLYCLSPPLPSVPVGNWYCLECLGSESESFGFGQGQEYSFDSFRRMADRFKRKWLGTRPSSYADLEKEFWRVVEGGTAPVEVLYGSDLDTGVYGSGFPRASDPFPSWSTAEAWDAGARNPWNVNNFPKLEGSMLRLVHDNIPGVMVPWIYIGMLFSSFCWHYEDHCFYSVNYLHCGEPKSWYSVPGTAAEEFEKVMKNAFPDLFEAQPDLLFQLVTMLNPTVLRDNGVPVCMTVQEPRNFVITFPRSYHGGFNHGFNCAEAVNFAPSDWLPYGGFGVERYRLYHKAAVLSHDELLCVVAKNDTSCGRSPWLQQELSRIIAKERHQREYLWSLGMVKSSQMTPRPCLDRIGAEEDVECIICRYYLHLSAVTCHCRPGKAVCLQHARQLCECSADQQCLLYRFTLAELDDLIGNEDQSLEDCKVGDLAAASSNNKRRLRRGQNGASSLTSPLMKKVKGRPYRHSELADTWLTQARGAGRSHLRSPVLEELLSQAEQFLWGGHEMDQVRAMVQKLNTAQKWVQDVAACSITVERHGHGSSGKAVKVSLATVQKLVTVDPIPWVEPHVQTLKALFEPARRLEEQIMEALKTSSELEVRVLHGLHQEASHSPFELSQVRQLKDLLNLAQVWSDRVRKVLPCTKIVQVHASNVEVGLEQLQALQVEGSNIPVMVGEKKLLDSAIESVTAWQQHATQLLASSCTQQELEEALRGSELLVVHPVEVGLLEDRLQKAKGWVQRAASALVQVQQQTDYAVSIKILEDLLRDGQRLQVDGLDQMGVLEAELQKVTWMHRASQTLVDYPTTNYLQDLIVEATRLQLADGKLVHEINATLRDASAWELKAEQLLSAGDSLVAFTELASAAERIHAKLSGLNPIQEAISEARHWLDRAQPFCKTARNAVEKDTADQLDLSSLQALVVDSQNLSVVLDEGKVLCTALKAAESWVTKASMLKASVFVSEQSEVQIEPLNKRLEAMCETEDRTSGSCSKTDADSSSRLEDDLVKLQNAVAEGMVLCLKIPEITELQSLANATKWTLKARQLVECSPTVKEVESHLEEATSLPVMVPEYSLLQGMLSDAKGWLQAAASFLPGFGIKGSCTEEQLEKLIADAQLLPVSVVSETSCLEDILSSHRIWKENVQHALAGTTSFTWSELLKLQEAGEADMVHTEEEHLLNSEVVETGSWMLRCHECIARQPAQDALLLEDLFLKMRSSVEFAIRYLESDDPKCTRELTCVCQRNIDHSDSNLLHCDICHDWYHPSCVGLTQAQTRGQKQYVCPYCTAISCGVLSINKDLRSKIHATERPQLSVLHELLSSAQMVRCRIKEKEILEGVVELVQIWQRRLEVLIGPALVCEERDDVVNYHSLVAAQKAVEAMEVQNDAEFLLEKALAANSWRHRVIRLLDESSKPILRTLTRTLKEGLAIPMSEEDSVMRELKEVEACASLWAARAKQAICDHGRMPLVDVHALIVEGEGLPVSLSKELSALRERSVLYCVCQKPYDEDRAMIACDRCGEWYHFSCINLPEPDSSDEDTDDAIQQECELSGDFVCPQCKELSMKGDHEVTGTVPTKSAYRDHTSGEDDAIHKAMEGAQFNGLVRGKRSNRSSNRTRGDLRHKWQSPLFASGKLLWHTQRRRKQHEQPDGSVSSSGRPCRRTAGRHSRFESFVLLMRSR